MSLRHIALAAALSLAATAPVLAAAALGQGQLTGWTEEPARKASHEIRKRTYYCRAESCPKDAKVMVLLSKAAPFGEFASFDDYLRKEKPTNAKMAEELRAAEIQSARGRGTPTSVKVTRKGNAVTFDVSGSLIMPSGPKNYYRTIYRYQGTQVETITIATRDASMLDQVSKTAMLLRTLD